LFEQWLKESLFLLGMLDNWPAITKWTWDYLMETVGNVKINYEKTKLSEVFHNASMFLS
jgi:hypothetical protein